MINRRMRVYYWWRIRTILKRLSGVIGNELTLITPVIPDDESVKRVSQTIESIVSQTNHPFQVRHLLVASGEVKLSQPAQLPEWYRQSWLIVPGTARDETALRNAAIHTLTSGWVMIVPAGCEFNEQAFSGIRNQLRASAGTLRFQVNSAAGDDPDYRSDQWGGVPQHSIFGFLWNGALSHLVDFQRRPTADFMFEENLTYFSRHYGFENFQVLTTIGNYPELPRG